MTNNNDDNTFITPEPEIAEADIIATAPSDTEAGPEPDEKMVLRTDNLI